MHQRNNISIRVNNFVRNHKNKFHTIKIFQCLNKLFCKLVILIINFFCHIKHALKFIISIVSTLIKRDHLFKTIPEVTPFYEVSFSIKPLGFENTGVNNILHLTTGGDYGKHGQRTPGVWFHNGTTKLHIISSINADHSHAWNSPTGLVLHKVSNIVILQNLINGKLLYRILIDDVKVYEEEVHNPRAFTNVKMYNADPWYPAAIAEINYLSFVNQNSSK